MTNKTKHFAATYHVTTNIDDFQQIAWISSVWNPNNWKIWLLVNYRKRFLQKVSMHFND